MLVVLATEWRFKQRESIIRFDYHCSSSRVRAGSRTGASSASAQGPRTKGPRPTYNRGPYIPIVE